MNNSSLSLIIPTFNEQENVNNILYNVNIVNATEVIVVDGGSTDETRQMLKGVNIITSYKSRGNQLKVGAKNSRGDWLLFVHADTTLDENNLKDVKKFVKNENIKFVAYFKLKYNSKNIFSYIIASWANFRTRLFRLPFGDQCILINRQFYDSLGGYSCLPIMEDIEFILRVSKNKRKLLDSYVTTSFQKYLKNGILKQSLNNLFRQIKFLINAK